MYISRWDRFGDLIGDKFANLIDQGGSEILSGTDA
jgi:hypothetical protein